MRLLEYNTEGSFSLAEFYNDDDTPKYAILSHTWGQEEVTYRDLVDGTGKDNAGYNKIWFCAKQAAKDSLRYFWVDTCCIDKSSSAELQEAINSMFRWYRNAVKCYVYLSDVSLPSYNAATGVTKASELVFRESRWFTRGWTLQELIAPTLVELYSNEGILLGDKVTLARQIHEITGIPIRAFQGSPLSEFSIPERMTWAKNRQTKREEDSVYSLLGIFDVHMPLIYGERREHALRRLNEEIQRSQRELIVRQATEQRRPLPTYGFDCHKCDRLFNSQSALAQHLTSSAHGLDCNKCGRSFGSQSALEQHLLSPAHGFDCHKCERTYNSQSALEQHLASTAHGLLK